jgi:hypothetical protein
MPYKKKKQSRKTTQSQRQSQKVIVNIGSKSAPRKKRGGGGGGGHRQNLAPTFITAPQVDYTPFLAMMTYQTRSLQPEPLRNPVTTLSSVTQALPAEQMAGEAAIRRAGRTAGSFQPVAHVERDIAERQSSGVAQLVDKFETLTRASSAETGIETPSSRASTQVALPSGFASIARIKQMGAEEEKGRRLKDRKVKQDKTRAQGQLRTIAKQAKIQKINEDIEPGYYITDEQRTIARHNISRMGINLTDLSRRTQGRTRLARAKD